MTMAWCLVPASSELSSMIMASARNTSPHTLPRKTDCASASSRPSKRSSAGAIDSSRSRKLGSRYAPGFITTTNRGLIRPSTSVHPVNETKIYAKSQPKQHYRLSKKQGGHYIAAWLDQEQRQGKRRFKNEWQYLVEEFLASDFLTMTSFSRSKDCDRSVSSIG